jgi:hypothetical protein
MALDKSLFVVKRFLKARTPEALVREQIKNNIKFSKTFSYDIIFDGKTWYAWYLFDHTELYQEKMNNELRGVDNGAV